MEYDLVGKGRIRDTIKIEDESHKHIIDEFLEKVEAINKFLCESYKRGDIIDVSGGFGSHSDGPYLGVDIRKVHNGFWKEDK